MKRSRHTQCDANPLCDGITTKDILAAPTIASIAGYLEDIGLSKTASRAIARKILMRRPANDLPSSNYWPDVWDHINQTMHRDEQGNPTGWGLFWMHVHLARASARAALSQLRTPYDPGSYRKEKNGWRKDRDHQWKVELCGVDENTTAHVAVSVLNCAALMTRALEQQKPDIGAALHLTFHLSELNLELALRLSGIRQLVDIGVSVSEKGALDGGLDPCAGEARTLLARLRATICRPRSKQSAKAHGVCETALEGGWFSNGRRSSTIFVPTLGRGAMIAVLHKT